MIQDDIADINDRLDRLSPRSPRLGVNPVGNFLVRYNDTTKGLTASFSINTKQGMGPVLLKRNFSKDPGSAKVLQTWDVTGVEEGQTLTYDDTDPDIRKNQNAYYWIDVVPLGGIGETLTVGPQQFINSADLNAPDIIADFDASHDAVSGGTVNVSVSFKSPLNDRFGSCKIYVTGYNGIAASVALAQNPTSPWSFKVLQTGETVTLTAIAVSKNGIEAATGPTKSLTLGATATVPAKVMSVTATQLTTGAQIGFPAGAESNITQYSLYRAAKGAGFGAAVSIGTVVPTGAFAYTFLDTGGLASPYEYYVLATNAIGNSTASAAAVFPDLSQVPDSSSRLAMTAGNTTYFPLSDPLSATDAGANSSIIVANFTMRITGKGDVAITGQSPAFTAKSYATEYWIYYDDPTMAGGAVTFQSSTTKQDAFNGAGRFCVGSVTTPSALGGPALGNNNGGGTAATGMKIMIGAVTLATVLAGNGVVANAGNSSDGDDSAKATLTVTGNSSPNSASLVHSAFPPVRAPGGSMTLKVKSGVGTNTLNGGTANVVRVQYSKSVGLRLGTPVYIDIFTLVSGVTRSVQVDSVVLGKVSMADVFFRALVSNAAGDSTGSLVVDIYEVWLENTV